MKFDLLVSQLREEAEGAHKHDHEMLFEIAAAAIEDLTLALTASNEVLVKYRRELERKEALRATANIRRAYSLVHHKESLYEEGRHKIAGE